MNGALFTGAFATGLLGSAHCLGMCGGLVGALSLRSEGSGGAGFHLFYHLGRISTYVLLGYLVGWLGLAVGYTGGFRGVGWYVLLGADLFVILLGLGSAGAFRRWNVMRLEFAGPIRALTTGVQRLRVLPPTLGALPLGLVMGLNPCGFLYAVLLNAALTAEPAAGALVMLGFGLGTAPALFVFGWASRTLGASARGWMLRAAGLGVAFLGAFNLLRHLAAPTCCG